MPPIFPDWSLLLRFGALVALVSLFTSCGRPGHLRVQGYVEGEFVYVSSPLSSPLQTLKVRRGDEVKAGDPLYELDNTVAKAALDQAQASLTFSEQDLKRQEDLSLIPGSASVRDLQLARSARDQNQQQLTQAQWNLSQINPPAPQADASSTRSTARASGSTRATRSLSCSRPRTSKSAPSCPRRRSARFIPATPVQVFADGISEPFKGTLRYIFPQAEYTPPVIYSQDSRGKLVFMVEVDFDPETAAKLNPGQPVDVEFGP